MIQRLALSGLVLAGSLGVLAPVSVNQGGGLGPAAAECETCCPQAQATCVVCGTDECVSHTGYYEGKIGPDGCDPILAT